MSFDMKQHVMMSSKSVLGNYFSNRSHAIKEDLESFKAFLILLKYKYMDRVEIPRTVIKLLHMYHPQDGYDAYMKLLKIICVLLEELDQDILKYLLSIIPPPNLYGSYDVKSMKDEVRGVTGFDLLSTPAFHTWVLPVLKNTSNIKQKDMAAESNSTNSTEVPVTQAQPTDDVKTDVQLAKNDNTDQNIENVKTTNVSSDNESITSEPKFENYDLYEIVGDLSKTILNQLSSKPEYHKLSPYKQMKNLFDIEAIMTPSALVGRTEYCENGEKKPIINLENENNSLKMENLTVDPVLEKSMKNFIARACGLLPNISSGEARENKEVKRKSDSNTKKKIDNCTKIKPTRQFKPKKSLLDELTRPKKKSLMSYLITPLDPITDTPINLSKNQDSKSDTTAAVNDMKRRTKTTLKKNVVSNNNTQTTEHVEIESSVEIKENIAPEPLEIKSSVVNIDTVNEKLPQVVPVATVLKVTNQIPVLTNNETQLKITEKVDAQSHDEKVDIQIIDEKFDIQTHNKTDIQTQRERNDVQTHNNTDDKNDDEKDGINEGKKEMKQVNVKEIQPAIIRQECDSNSGVIEFPCKNADLEWNRENMKLFGINTIDEDICTSESEIKVVEDNEDKNNPILPVSAVHDNSVPAPVSHGFSLYKSHTSKEYLSYLHDLAVAKCASQTKDPFPLLIKEDKEPSQTNEDKKLANENNQNEILANSLPKFESCPPSKVQPFNPPTRSWSEYAGAMYDPQLALNIQIQRNLPVSLHSDPTKMRQYVQQATPINTMSGSVLGSTSIPVSYESAYPTIPISQEWMMKPTSTPQHMPHSSWATYTHYAQNSIFREMAQQRARFSQRTAFLQPSSTVNNYINPPHPLMMNGFWSSYPSMRTGVYARTGDMPAVMPSLPHAVYPVTDPMRQQQRMRAMSQGVLPNFVASHLNAIQAPPQPSKNKRRKLEEIVGRLKEAEKNN